MTAPSTDGGLDFRALFNNMLNGLAYCKVLTDGPRPHDFVYLEVNEVFAALTGLNHVVGKRVTEVVPGIRETDPGLLDLYSEVATTGRPRRFERYVAALDMWFAVSVYSPKRDHFVALFDVISEKKRAEASLLRSEERLHALIDNSTDIIAVVDGDGKTLFASPSLAASVGRTPQQARGLSIFEHVHPDDAEGLRESLASVTSASGATVRATFRFAHESGGWRQIEADARNLLHDPAVQGIVVNARDVTEQRKLEEQFQHAQKLESVGRLAGGVAHDFNNLLTVIISSAAELRRAVEAHGAIDLELVKDIETAGERGSQLTRQLLAFARRGVVTMRPLDLNEVVGGAEHMLRRVLGEDVELRLERAGDLWPTVCDAGQVAQVLMNLAVNARDAMPGGGTLTVETRNADVTDPGSLTYPEPRAGQWTQLLVTDTGGGMPPEVLAHVFEPFFTTKPTGRGTGLGLATVYGIVTQGGGHIHVESAVGKGTTFRICLPRSLREVEATGATTEVGTLGRGTGTVLVVEDEPMVRNVTVRALAGAGFHVRVASDGKQAISLDDAEVRRLDLVVTDMVMPGLGGAAVAEDLRRRHPSLPVLFVSGYPRDGVVIDSTPGRTSSFLSKPFTKEMLLTRVQELLDGRYRDS